MVALQDNCSIASISSGIRIRATRVIEININRLRGQPTGMPVMMSMVMVHKPRWPSIPCVASTVWPIEIRPEQLSFEGTQIYNSLRTVLRRLVRRAVRATRHKHRLLLIFVPFVHHVGRCRCSNLPTILIG